MTKWALITGASAGIGLELAKLFANDGVSVVLVARRRALLETLAGELKANTKNGKDFRAEVIDIDLGLSDSHTQIANQLKAKNISIDYLVNNAGFGSNGYFHKLPLDRELQMIDLNVRALVALTHELLPAMITRGSGRILNVGSTAGFQPGPFMATYYASKAFVNSFSEALSVELKDTGVTSTVLCPGPVATEFFKVAEAMKMSMLQGQIAGPADVARYGYQAMMRGQVVAVHGLKFKILLQSLRVSPRGAIRAISGRMNRKIEELAQVNK